MDIEKDLRMVDKFDDKNILYRLNKGVLTDTTGKTTNMSIYWSKMMQSRAYIYNHGQVRNYIDSSIIPYYK